MKQLSLKTLSPRHRALQQASATLQRQRATPLSLKPSAPRPQPCATSAPTASSGANTEQLKATARN